MIFKYTLKYDSTRLSRVISFRDTFRRVSTAQIPNTLLFKVRMIFPCWRRECDMRDHHEEDEIIDVTNVPVHDSYFLAH